LGAVAVVLGTWYLRQTGGRLIPPAFPVLGDDCTCDDANLLRPGYRAADVRPPTAAPRTWGQFQ